ncbi:MAG: DUF3365 domain-containing protein [Proteobacteria bacterium]|nr:DUF3365 domain-containing protein [Pseudomonadota bacterium]MDA1331853.1 DUF3365 domain-containing protein [Pseudomonadota bacterium]
MTTLILLLNCGLSHAKEPISNEALIGSMQSIAIEFMESLGKSLKTAMSSHGPEAAIQVCETVAPTLANQFSRRTGWKVSRVSLKVRNPLIGTADTWEREQLLEFAAKVLSGKPDKNLEVTFIDHKSGKTIVRYMKALPTAPICLTCHGNESDIPNDVSKTLNRLYPFDQAKGYKVGEIRGAISIQAFAQ